MFYAAKVLYSAFLVPLWGRCVNTFVYRKRIGNCIKIPVGLFFRLLWAVLGGFATSIALAGQTGIEAVILSALRKIIADSPFLDCREALRKTFQKSAC